jgi:hypothetical protein
MSLHDRYQTCPASRIDGKTHPPSAAKYVCMYVCMHVKDTSSIRGHVCMYACLYACIPKDTSSICGHVFYVRMYVCMYTEG